MANTFDFSTLIAILPQLGIFLLGAVVLLLDLFWKDEERSPFAYVTAAGLVIVGVISAIWARPGAAGQLVFGGMLRWDWMSFLFTMLFLFGGAVTSLFIRDYPQTGKQGEFYVLMLTSILDEPDGWRSRFDYAVPGNRDHLHSAVCVGGFSA